MRRRRIRLRCAAMRRLRIRRAFSRVPIKNRDAGVGGFRPQSPILNKSKKQSPRRYNFTADHADFISLILIPIISKNSSPRRYNFTADLADFISLILIPIIAYNAAGLRKSRICV